MSNPTLVERVAALEMQVADIRNDVRELNKSRTLGNTAARALAEDLRGDLRKIQLSLHDLHREFRTVQNVQRLNAPTIERMRAINRGVAAVLAALGGAMFIFAEDVRATLHRIWATFRN